jgi:hypothetical protein
MMIRAEFRLLWIGKFEGDLSSINDSQSETFRSNVGAFHHNWFIVGIYKVMLENLIKTISMEISTKILEPFAVRSL